MDQIARTPKQLGAALRRRRRLLRLSQAALGARTNLRQATISALENGEPGTQLRTLLDVMAALELELAVRDRSKANENVADLF
jgi:HTH-type transcriptional regulator/antitoxin HipB